MASNKANYVRNKENTVDHLLSIESNDLEAKIIVLDDDPTGTQTVHDIPVYTDWSEESVDQIFEDSSKLVYILTNSRSFSESKTRVVHQTIAKRIAKVANGKSIPFILISRGDSTLRGHYPLETETLKETLEESLQIKFDGEIVCPAFFEGGRYTINNIHYLEKDGERIPVGKTEFAKDQTFGFQSSDLRKYINEKSHGRYSTEDCISIPNDYLSNQRLEEIQKLIKKSCDFKKIIVNATDYFELKVFVICLIKEIKQGKNFLFRTAASFPKVLANIVDQAYLSKESIVDVDCKEGGLTVIGSHVPLTTSQFEYLRKTSLPLKFIEFDVQTYLEGNNFEKETKRVAYETETNIKDGVSVVVYTSRALLFSKSVDKEKTLAASVRISEALTKIVSSLTVKPKYIIAKGGITSSDIATKGLSIKKAIVVGQACAGVPVWLAGEDSKFPRMPYLIFPGNVGTEKTLYEIIEKIER